METQLPRTSGSPFCHDNDLMIHMLISGTLRRCINKTVRKRFVRGFLVTGKSSCLHVTSFPLRVLNLLTIYYRDLTTIKHPYYYCHSKWSLSLPNTTNLLFTSKTDSRCHPGQPVPRWNDNKRSRTVLIHLMYGSLYLSDVCNEETTNLILDHTLLCRPS